jgi:hypothetical protein
LTNNDSQKSFLTITGVVLTVVLLGPYLGYNLLGNGPDGAMRVTAPGTYTGTDPAQPRRDTVTRESRDARDALDIDELTRKPAQPASNGSVREPVKRDPQKGSGKLSEIENLLR